jgi:AAA+ ATPase superfamily predicted ATPase
MKENVVIALDEVQELSSISGKLLEVLGRVFATYSNISFIFTGSMFGLMRTLLEPTAKSPLYGRPPARIILNPFNADVATQFLQAGFSEQGMQADSERIGAALDRLNGIPGWLTLYGSKACIEHLPQDVALQETENEAEKIVVTELKNFLAGRNNELYLSVMRAATYGARWSEIRGAVEARIGTVNPTRLSAVLKSLRAAMIIEEKEGFYRMIDPIVRRVVLTRLV